MSIAQNETAPAFTLNNQNGESVSLKDYQGKHVILYFYPKDDTPGCTKQACGFRDIWADIEKTGAVVLGVSPDDAASHTRFISQYNLPLTLLSDPDKAMMTRYQAYGEKIMYGKKTIGIIRSTVWIGADGKIIKHWKKVPNAAAHPAKVLQALQAFQPRLTPD